MPKVISTSSEVHDQHSPKSSSNIHEKGQIMETSIHEEPNSIIESKKRDDETLTTLPKTTSESVPRKGKKGISQDAKNILEEKVENIGEEKRVDRKDTNEESENACALGKPTPKGKKKHVIDETSFITKSEENGKGKGKAKVEIITNGKFGDTGSPKRKGIKGVAASTSHAMTSLVKRFNEEDLMFFTSATVLVLALGVYASYKLRSTAK